MLFIESQKNKYYLTKSVKINNQWKKIRKYIGSTRPIKDPKELLGEYIDFFTHKEFELKKYSFEKLEKYTFNPELIEDIERKNIFLQNLIESKNLKNLFLKEFSKKFIFNSNNIEGSKIPEKEVENIIEERKTEYFNRNEVKEVFNSESALIYLIESFNFNINSMKRLYNILTKGLLMQNGLPYPRGFRKIPVVVNDSATYEPEVIEESLKNLLKWYHENKKVLHPFILAFEFHLRYERIHPFEDANGRTGRLLMNRILLAGNYLPIIIFKENRRAYYNAIKKSLDYPNQKNYFDFMFKQTHKSYRVYHSLLEKYV